MARNRVIYQSEALFVSKDASLLEAADHKQIERVQSANFSYTINRQDINQFGELARIDSVILDAPTVSTDFSYYLTDGFNERALGFYVNTGGGDSLTNIIVNESGVLYTKGTNQVIKTTGLDKVTNNLGKTINTITSVGTLISSGSGAGKVEGIVPGIGKITNSYNNVSKVTETYKNVVGGNITAVTQVSSAVSTVGKAVNTVGRVARSIGRVFGF